MKKSMFENLPGSYVVDDKVMSIRAETVEPNRQSGILFSSHDLCQKISNHLLSDTVAHGYLPKSHIAPYKVVPYGKMPHVS